MRFLAESWHVTSAGMFAASCIGVAFLVVSMELLRRLGKEYDAFILRQFQNHISSRSTDLKSTPNACQTSPSFVTFRATPLQQLIRSALHAATFGVAYIVMLLAMYFNGYIIISIIIGAFIGKFLCDWLVVRIQVGSGSGPSNRGNDNVVEEATVCCG
ncbi:hypothetical protein LTR84_003586 [Exophiala bonariae]|uniref:Copper transport protein n=1 Tax=Exophiala bonariae TaxID=1690606 RepID=A0AAV9NC22_9EURO|nr:hypothetical protein LTR84_003586 [Exophiala bonariae]